MKTRFVLDESSWSHASGHPDQLQEGIQFLLERIECATDRSEGLARHPDFYEVDLGGGVQLYSALFEVGCPIAMERDTAERLRLALDRTPTFSDAAVQSYDVSVGGAQRFSPGIAWAHSELRAQRSVAVLPLCLDSSLSGDIPVTVGGVVLPLTFVVTDSDHCQFFRKAISVENVDADAFDAIAPSAFPHLYWVDGVWAELRNHRRYFFAQHRDTLVTHLSVLNDSGAKFFMDHPGGQGVEAELASKGVDASSESGTVRAHRPSLLDRQRVFEGMKRVFWWHTKIMWNVGRIHFLYLPPDPNLDNAPHGRIVVGIFAEHCHLPN